MKTKTLLYLILLTLSGEVLAKSSCANDMRYQQSNVTCLIKIHPTLILDGNKIIRISVSPLDSNEIRIFFGSGYDSYTAVTAKDPIGYIEYLYKTVNECNKK